MTAQLANTLKNECPEADFGNRALYWVFVGDDVSAHENHSAYPFKAKPNKSKMTIFTACWSGYRSTYQLHQNGELSLIDFHYPCSEDASPDQVNEKLSGDFWLDLRSDFFAGSVYVPFRNGKVVLDQSEWVNCEKDDGKERKRAGSWPVWLRWLRVGAS